MPDIDLTERCHRILSKHIHKGDVAVDCTAGNGRDTMFLADAVGPEGKVLSFDVQKQAIRNTEALIGGKRPWVELYLASNAHMWKYVNFVPSVVMYDLGYLENGSRTVMTQSEDTLASVTSAVRIVGKGGAVSIITRPDHDEGAREECLLLDLLKSLPEEEFEVSTYKGAGSATLHIVVKK